MFKGLRQWLFEKTLFCVGMALYFIVGLSATIIDVIVYKVEQLWQERYSDKLLSLNHLKLKLFTLTLLLVFCIGVGGIISVRHYLGGLETEEINSENKRKAEENRFEQLLKTNKEMVQFRYSYGEVLASSFKKNKMHVEVIVSGPNNEIMKINCLFFDSRWPSAIEGNGLLDNWKSFGFKKVTISDTFGYSYTWAL